MSVYELIDIADRFERLNDLAVEFGWDRKMLMSQIYEVAVQLREEADDLAEAMAKSEGPYETDLWYDTSKELA